MLLNAWKMIPRTITLGHIAKQLSNNLNYGTSNCILQSICLDKMCEIILLGIKGFFSGEKVHGKHLNRQLCRQRFCSLIEVKLQFRICVVPLIFFGQDFRILHVVKALNWSLDI